MKKSFSVFVILFVGVLFSACSSSLQIKENSFDKKRMRYGKVESTKTIVSEARQVEQLEVSLDDKVVSKEGIDVLQDLPLPIAKERKESRIVLETENIQEPFVFIQEFDDSLQKETAIDDEPEKLLAKDEGYRIALVSLLLGALSVLSILAAAVFAPFFILALLAAIAALVTGIIGRRKYVIHKSSERVKQFSTAGIFIGGVVLVLSLVLTVAIAAILLLILVGL